MSFTEAKTVMGYLSGPVILMRSSLYSIGTTIWDVSPVTYNPVLKKFIMCVTDGGTTVSKMNTYLLESDKIDGDWKIITYMKEFGTQAYFVKHPF